MRIIESFKYIFAILLLSLSLNLWGINWGLPNTWHPDEITPRAMAMFDNRTLNPHYFAYGSIHYYQIIFFAVIPEKVLNKVMPLDDTTQNNVVIVLSRALSGLMGTGIVFMTFLLAKALFNEQAALFSSLLLTVSMGFVGLSHFATTEMPSIFWFTFSCLMSTYASIHKTRKWYFLAGLFSGFAAAVKYIGGVSLLTLFVAHFLSQGRKNKGNLAIGVLMALIGFLIANPVLIFSFYEFADGFIKENSYNSARETDAPYAFLPLVFELRNGLGIPLFLLLMGAILYSIKLFTSNEYRKRVLLVWSMIFFHYIVMGSMHSSRLRYIVPVVPFLLILTGKMISDFTSSNFKAVRIVSIASLGIVISFSLVYTVAADMEFTHDARYLTYDWVSKNVKDGSKIEMTSNGPDFPNDKRYIVVKRPLDPGVNETASLTKTKPTYLFLQAMISKLKSVTGDQEKPYAAWWEKAIDQHQKESMKFDLSVSGLETRRPDYLIVSSLYFHRFLGDESSVEGQFFDALLSGKTSYKKVAEFKYRFLPLANPAVDFVNPTIDVYRAAALTQN